MATTIKGVVGGGLTISASPATIDIPTGYLVDEEDTFDNSITITITIPNGVKVIEVFAEASANYDNPDYDVWLNIFSNNKPWYDGSSNGDDVVAFTGYIGVTPNKQYSITVYTNMHVGRSTIDRFYIRYSPEINNQTPTVTDY